MVSIKRIEITITFVFLVGSKI